MNKHRRLRLIINQLRVNIHSPAAKITLIYLVVSIVWILISDKMAIGMAGNNAAVLEKVQFYKGLFFVFTLAFILYYLSNKFYKDIQLVNLNKEVLEQDFAALNTAAHSGIIDIDLLTKRVITNEKMRFFIQEPSPDSDDFLSTYYKHIHPNDRKRMLREYLGIFNNDQSLWKTEYRILASDNQYYHVISSIYITRNDTDYLPLKLIGELQDITQLRNLQSDYFDQQLKHKQRLASSIIKAQENERNRWAEELHDNVSQLLSVVNLYLSSIDVIDESNKERLLKAKTIVADAQQEIRLLSASIKPPSFSEMSLHESIEQLIGDITRIKDIRLKFETNNLDENKLNEPQKLLMYRVVQEQLNNIIKYAEANLIVITISIDASDIVQILIADDGKGFDTSSKKTGIGFRNIQSRLQLYKGDMLLQSAPGKGCRLLVSFHI